MTRSRASGRSRALVTVAGLVGTFAVAACAATGGETADGLDPVLAHDASLAAVAVDRTLIGMRVRPPEKFTDDLLDDAGITLGDGTVVSSYERSDRTVELANPDDAFQLCVTDEDGAWVTYGDSTGVQDSGGGGSDDGACTFSGDADPDAPFDVRMVTEPLWDAFTSVEFVESQDDTWGSDPEARALVEAELPEGWTTSRVDQRGYSAWQYCLTSPEGEWFYVHDTMVEGYGDEGRCRLDPHMDASN